MKKVTPSLVVLLLYDLQLNEDSHSSTSNTIGYGILSLLDAAKKVLKWLGMDKSFQCLVTSGKNIDSNDSQREIS